MKTISVLSGDKRQYYAHNYLNQHGFSSSLKNNMDFSEDQYILCSTPFLKKNEYINCDFHSSFPINTFIGLLKPGQIIFGGKIPNQIKEITCEKNIIFVDLLDDEFVVWNNAYLTAESLIGEIITESDFSLCNANIFILGFGKCGMNIARLLKPFGCNIFIYDHTPNNMARANSFGYQIVSLETFDNILPAFNIIINTVPSEILSKKHYSLINSSCLLYDISSIPYGFNNHYLSDNNLSVHTSPGLPGKYAPKTAGELIAKSIISYLERTR